MKTLLLNLPHTHRIQRRYMCSYNAPNMLLPPQELIALGGILRDWKKDESVLIDAIAEDLSFQQTAEKVKEANPDLIVTISGFECFEEDMTTLHAIHQAYPKAKVVLFGHYATLFYKEILSKYDFDYIILDEPDLKFSHLYDAIAGKMPLTEVEGIAYMVDNQIVVQPGDNRIPHPDELPMPAYELLKPDLYFEPFLRGPFGLIQTARGCPYECNYCVKSFGKRLAYRTPEQIVDEIVYLKKKFGIRSLRFIDDTFTVHAKRVIEICKRMIDLNLNIEWTCLSRTDTLREEMIPWMKKAGCRRIYFGVESGSPKVLKYLDKDMDLEQSLRNVQLCRANGIETLGFFIVGAPVEEEEDFEMSIDFAIRANLDYVVVSEIIPYPGTPFFEQVKDRIDFSVFPYKNVWKDPEVRERNKRREKEFYRRYYFRKDAIKNSIKRIVNHPVEFLQTSLKLASFITTSKQQKRDDFI